MARPSELTPEQRTEIVLALFAAGGTGLRTGPAPWSQHQHPEPVEGGFYHRWQIWVGFWQASFLAKRFREFIADDFQHVRIQYRTPPQLGLLERFHQNFKNEEVYWRVYENPGHCRQCLEACQEVYNTVRPHWALKPEVGDNHVTPADVYAGGIAITIPKWQHWAEAAKKKLQEMMAADAGVTLAACPS